MADENIGRVAAFAYPNLVAGVDYVVTYDGSAYGITFLTNPNDPDPAPTFAEVMANEAAWLAADAAESADASGYLTDRAGLLADAAAAVTDLNAYIAEADAYEAATPLDNTAAEVRTHVRKLNLALRRVMAVEREIVKLLAFIVEYRLKQ
jgi:hypothetical protein